MRHKLLNLLTANKGRGFYRVDSGADGNIIYIYDIIVAADADAAWWGGVSAETFVKTLAGMSGPVALHINSPGGDAFGGIAMLNAIKAYDGEVTAYVDGYAASAAADVAVACDKVVMSGEASMMMIHKAITGMYGNADDFRDLIALLDKIDLNLANLFAGKSGKSSDEIMKLLNAGDTWFSAAEAVSFGLADEIAAGKDKGASNADQPRWDLSAYGSEKVANKTETLNLTIDTSAIVAAIENLRRDLKAQPAGQAEETESEDERDRRLRIHQTRLLNVA